MTNIARDIKEDYLRVRIYLPLDEMQRFGCSEDDIRQGRLNDAFISLLKSHIERCRSFYASARAGIQHVEGMRPRLVILAIKEIYAAILDEIEKNRYDVFSKRAYVSLSRKFVIALAIICKKGYGHENKPG